jgi:DNA-binding response OmpR family regulator
MARVLIVDDDAPIRTLMKVVLTHEGHDVVQAAGAREGLAAIEEQLPDVVLLDLLMPEMDGWLFLDELRSRGLRNRTRVVIVSAFGDAPTVERGRAAGALGHITKPFEIEALVAAVRSALEQEPQEMAHRRERVEELGELIKEINTLVQ